MIEHTLYTHTVRGDDGHELGVALTAAHDLSIGEEIEIVFPGGSQVCRVSHVIYSGDISGVTMEMEPVGTTGLYSTDWPAPTKDDAKADLIDAMYIAQDEGLTPAEMREVIAVFFAEQEVEPERAPGVKPSIAGLGETAPDMRYRGLGFCEE